MRRCDLASSLRSQHRQYPVVSNRPGFDQQIALMSTSALFAGLLPGECREILSYARMTTFNREEVLFAQGEPVDKLVFLLTGSVKLSQLSSDGDEVILWMNGPEDALGLRADAVDGGNHSCSARAMERSHVLIWDYSRHKELMARHPQINVNIGTILHNRLHELEERFREIATERVSKRLASVLIRLVQSVGRQSREGVELGLKREELAQMTGATLFTISRIIAKWVKSGFIVRHREGMIIRDLERLKAFSI
jgi:CRP/FNR family transcriptional regulator, nitrogen oxide reductase regulator